MDKKDTFGTRLKAARKDKNITQAQLADMLKHKSYRTRISDWEADKNALSAIGDFLKICFILKQDPFKLFFGDRDKKEIIK